MTLSCSLQRKFRREEVGKSRLLSAFGGLSLFPFFQFPGWKLPIVGFALKRDAVRDWAREDAINYARMPAAGRKEAVTAAGRSTSSCKMEGAVSLLLISQYEEGGSSQVLTWCLIAWVFARRRFICVQTASPWLCWCRCWLLSAGGRAIGRVSLPNCCCLLPLTAPSFPPPVSLPSPVTPAM